MVGEGFERTRQIAAAHLDRTLQNVEVEHALDVAMQIAVIFQQVGYGGVEIGFLALRRGHFAVVADRRVAAYGTHEIEIGLVATLVVRHQNIRHDDSAGIDERIARYAVLDFELDQGVERGTRRLAPYPAPQRFALQAERRSQRKDLRNGLYRETLRRIAEQILPSVDRIETNAGM